jgi:hypothetical protein
VKLIARRAEATAAFIELERRKGAWSQSTRVVRAWCARHRAGVIVGGGFATGLITTLLPVAPIMRLVSAAAGAASLMLEGPLLRLLMAGNRDSTNVDGSGSDSTAPTP